MATDLNSSLNLDQAISNLDLLIARVEKLNGLLGTFSNASVTAANSQNKVNEAQKQSDTIVDEVVNSMAELNKIQQQNAKVQAQMNVATTDSSKELAKNKIALQEEQKAIRDSIKAENDRISTEKAVSDALKTTAKTIGEAQAQNKALRKAVKDVDTTTEAGRATIAKYNKVIDENDTLIRENSDNLIKTKINIGNYTESIKQAVPSIDSMTQSIKAFLANPILLTVTAITTAFNLLKNALGSTEEGQKVLNTLTGVFSGILTGLNEIVIAATGPLIALFNDPKQAVEDLVTSVRNRLITAFENLKNIGLGVGTILQGIFELDSDKIKQGAQDATTAFIEMQRAVNPIVIAGEAIYNKSLEIYDIAKQTGQIEAERTDLASDRNKFIIREAELSRDIAQSREIAKNTENDINDRVAAIAQAEELIKTLSDERIAIKQRELNLLIQEQGLSSNNLEDNKQAAQLQAEIIGLQEQQANQLRSIYRDKQSINSELEKQIELEQARFDAAQIQRDIEKEQAAEDAAIQAELDAIDQEDFQKYIEEEEKKKELAAATAQAKKDLQADATSFILGDAAKAFGLEKEGAIAQAVINTAQGVTKAIAQGGVAGIGTGILVGAAGALQIAKISGISAFYKGTKNAPKGLAFVSERGAELIQDKNGVLRLVPDMSLVNLQGGEKIYTAKETKQMMFDDSRIIRELRQQKTKVVVNIDNNNFSYKYRMHA